MSLVIVRALQRRHRLMVQPATFCKFYCSDKKSDEKDEKNKLLDPAKLDKYSRKNVRRNVEGYLFPRFFDYVQNYDKILEKNFPKAMHVYRVFMVGVKDFFKDMKSYWKISKIVSGTARGLEALNRKEIELYYQMPKDMIRVAPVLLISALPFANYVIFPLAFMFPRHLLTSHFWSIEQRINFQQQSLKERISCNRRIFRMLQARRDLIEDKPHYSEFKKILGLLGSGFHPTAEEILAVRNVFEKPPFHLNFLSSAHVKLLCHLHGIHSLYLSRVRLCERSFMLQQMDQAIKREGGVHNMPTEALRKCCFIRGLNAQLLSNEEMVNWLNDWVKVSLEISSEHFSLFLHLPILLSYNYPTNWALLHDK